MTRPKPLELTEIPLHGLHLIEASAGTGKTYVITNLVLRMLLEEGRGLDQVLILTFTRAATEELRERIAARLRETLAVLERQLAGEAHPAGGPDPVLQTLLARRLAAGEGELTRVRLGEAISRQDEAAIDTIHGFCYRLLREHAFESGVPFDPELIQDQRPLERLAVQDLWRRTLAAADDSEAGWLLATWPRGPDGLRDTLRACQVTGEVHILPADLAEPEPSSGQAPDRLVAWLARLREAWGQHGEDVLALLRNAEGLSKVSYQPASIDQLPAAMAALLGPLPPAKLPDRFALLTNDKLRRATTKGHQPPSHPLFDLASEVSATEYAGLVRRRRAAFLARARRAFADGVARLKAARRVLYFDDLLGLTAAALQGPQGPALAERLRTTWPRVLIDEFQDTDPLQYQLFDDVYRGRPGCGLFLIGDPKQAIYAFRGADVFTYLRARRSAAQTGSLWTLDTNWRSASALVRAVNALYQRAPDAFVQDRDIPFHPVVAGGRADGAPLTIDGRPAAAVELHWLPSDDPSLCSKRGTPARLSAEGARTLAARTMAGRIAELLALGQAGRARLGDRPLAPGDVAVLVRTHDEGRLIRQALAGVGVACVSVGKDSVFATEEAAELSLLLAGLEEGADEASLRAALATRLLGWDAARIAALDVGETGWDDLLGRFETYRRLWREQGFLPAFWRLLHGEGVSANLRRLADGERRLTNLLHLAELAQLAARAHPGGAALRRWLDAQRADPPSGDDSLLPRLESDADLVQIVTLHKSKGLQFPVVCLPFPWSRRVPDDQPPVLSHDPEGSPVLDLGSDQLDDALVRRRQEALAEQARLLYVGLTRAQHLCLLAWGAVAGAGDSAAARLLHPQLGRGADGDPWKGLNDAALLGSLADLPERTGGALVIVHPGAAGPEMAQAAAPAPPALVARPFTAPIRTDWRLASFSGLASGAERDRPDDDADGPVGEPAGAAAADPPPAVSADPVFRFPRGARAGRCLHDLLEHLDFPQAHGAVLSEAIAQTLARHGIAPGWAGAAAELVRRTLDTPLAANGLRLRDIGAAERRNELEFHFSIQGLQMARLDDLLAAHGYPRPGLTGSEPLRGLMKGYIDLVFRWDGRYYIADYKSNHLGDRPEDYDQAGLAAAMAEHRYHLQSLIYCLALHRWLKRGLAGYDPAQHFGGVWYLFLRGLSPSGTGVFHDRPSPALIQALDEVFGADDAAG